MCPLLAALVGPGAAWVDMHRALLAEVSWTFRNVDSSGKLSASRIDLILANHAAMPLVQSASVLESVSDGGHSPVLVWLAVQGPVVLPWHRPLPRLPEMLQLDHSSWHTPPHGPHWWSNGLPAHRWHPCWQPTSRTPLHHFPRRWCPPCSTWWRWRVAG